jgi:opacity protein-like surface antigen
MRQLKKIMFIAMLTAIFISSTYAKEKKAYVGFNIGKSSYSNLDRTGGSHSKPSGWGISLGYKFNKYVALEVESKYFGEAKYTKDDGAGQKEEISDEFGTNGLSVIGSYPINKVSLFAKLGMHSWKYNFKNNITNSGISITFSDSKSGTNIFYGVGADYRFTDRFSVRLDYNKYDLKAFGDKAELEKHSITYYSLGASYHF